MQQKEKDDLIVVVVNSGCDDAVMSAAKSAGARGHDPPRPQTGGGR
ncbi:MAG: hypothetical protein ACLSAF_14100 [Intestinimonas sp.]